MLINLVLSQTSKHIFENALYSFTHIPCTESRLRARHGARSANTEMIKK